MLRGESSCERCNQLADNLKSLRSDYDSYAAGAQEALMQKDKLIESLQAEIAAQNDKVITLLQGEISALKARLESGVMCVDRTTESSE